MTDNLPDVVDDTDQSTDVVPAATQDTDSWIQVVADVAKFAKYIADTDFVPRSLRGNAAATSAAILYGREVGLPPMAALTQTQVIEGKPGIGANAMRGLILAAGHELVWDETTGAVCTLRGRRKSSERWHTVTWTLDMAKAAGLVKPRSGWERVPRAMLKARCTSEMARDLFPDVIQGFATVEELDDDRDPDAPTPTKSTSTVSRKSTRKSTSSRRRLTSKRTEPETPAEPAAETPQPPLPGEDEPAPEPAPEPDTNNGGETKHEPADTTPSTPTGHAPSRGQVQAMQVAMRRLGYDERAERLSAVSRFAGRDVTSTTLLSRDEAGQLLDTISRCRDRAAFDAILDAAEQDTGPNVGTADSGSEEPQNETE